MKSAVIAQDLIAANEAAATYYRQMLLGPGGEGPRAYLSSRGFPTLLQDTPWSVGYAPTGWTRALDHLRAQGFDDPTLLEAGIASVTKHGCLIDRFRDRITFGIRDPRGRLVAFLGRAAPNSRQGTPKYLGSPVTSIHSKGEVLLGLYEHTQRLATGRPIVIVEGPFDAIAVSEATDYPSVALCGTAMTRTQTSLLANKREGVILCLDSDPVGQAATVRSSLLLWQQKLSTSVARLPQAGDPASLPRNPLVQALRSAVPAEREIVKVILVGRPGLTDNVEAQLAALRYAARVLAEAPPPNEAMAALRLVRETHLGHDVVTAHLAAAITSRCEAVAVPSRFASRLTRTAGRRNSDS